MRKPIFFMLLLSAAIASKAPTLGAENVAEELPAASHGQVIVTYRRVRVNESLPQLGARLYDKVAYELQLSEVDAELKLTKARLDAQRERTQFYDKYFGRTPALLLTRQDAHLAELESELRLRQLRKRKQLLLRHRQDAARYRRLVGKQGEVELNINN